VWYFILQFNILRQKDLSDMIRSIRICFYKSVSPTLGVKQQIYCFSSSTIGKVPGQDQASAASRTTGGNNTQGSNSPPVKELSSDDDVIEVAELQPEWVALERRVLNKKTRLKGTVLLSSNFFKR
jgi:hypothetical protein